MMLDGIQTRRIVAPDDDEVIALVACPTCLAAIGEACGAGDPHDVDGPCDQRMKVFEQVEAVAFRAFDRETRSARIMEARAAGMFVSCLGERCEVCCRCAPRAGDPPEVDS